MVLSENSRSSCRGIVQCNRAHHVVWLMGRHICTICANVYIFGNHKHNMQLVKYTLL